MPFLCSKHVLPCDNATNFMVFAKHRQVSQTHSTEEPVAPNSRGMLRHCEAAQVGVGSQINDLLIVLIGQYSPYIVKTWEEGGVTVPQHLLVRYQTGAC